MLSRKAMVSSRIEKAQGLTLSMSAATPTSGSSHLPPSLTPHSAVVPKLANLNTMTSASSDTPAATMRVSFRSIGSGRNVGGEVEFDRPAGVAFNGDDSLRGSQPRRTVRGRIEGHANEGRFARLERFVHGGQRTVARHAVAVDHFHPLHERRGGAHAGGIDLADERLGFALVPEPEPMRDLAGRHGDGAEVESGLAGLQPAGGRGGGA